MRPSRSLWSRFPRPLAGLAALILYGVCALLLPALHLSSHDRPHDHLPQGLRLHPLGAAHLLAGTAHDESAANHHHDLSPLAQPTSTDPTWSAPQPHPPLLSAHGQGSLAHFAAGYLAAEPCASLPAASCLIDLPPPSPLTSRPLPRPISIHAPRAPPVLGS